MNLGNQSVRWSYSPNKKNVTCFISTLRDNNGKRAELSAKGAKIKNDCKLNARFISFKGAMNTIREKASLNREERTNVWRDFFNTVKSPIRVQQRQIAAI